MKKIILIALLIINSFSMFAELPKEIQNLEKIRWVFCGIGEAEGPGPGFDKSERLELRFNLPSATKLYKYVQKMEYKFNPQDALYAVSYYSGYSDVIFEYKNSYLFDNFYFKFSDKEIDERISEFNIKSFSLKRLESYFGAAIIREDGKPTDYRNLEGAYRAGKEMIQIKKLPDNQYDGYVYVSDINDEIFSGGGHYLKYDKKSNSFVSDGAFKNEKQDYTFYDDFKIKILTNKDKSKILLLDTPVVTLPYVPMEDYFVPNECKVHIDTLRVNGKNYDTVFYSEPSESSKIAFILSKDHYSYYLPIIDTVEELTLMDGVISKWVKIRNKDGQEGWIWGGKCYIRDDYNSDLSKSVSQRYKHLKVNKLEEK